MPTGYTADIKDGITFSTFAMNCARAFGACIELRDEPGGGENIPEQFVASSYHADRVAGARSELASFNAMPPAEHERQAAKAWDDAEMRRLMRLEEMRVQRKAYEDMLAKVYAWAPPTSDHTHLKGFMCEQITLSIDCDCDESYYSTPTVRLTGEQWAAERLAALEREVSYHQKEHAEEVERAASRTAWVKALRASLQS